MPFKRNGSYVIDDIGDIPPDLRSPADVERLKKMRSAKQKKLNAERYRKLWGEKA